MSDVEYDDLEPQRGHMAPLWTRRLFGFFGVDTYTEDNEDDVADGSRQ